MTFGKERNGLHGSPYLYIWKTQKQKETSSSSRSIWTAPRCTASRSFQSATAAPWKRRTTQTFWSSRPPGRVRNFIPPCLTELPFIRYAITSNGGAVWDILENKVLCTDLIPTETALEVQKIFDDYELYVEYYVHGRGVTKRGNPDKARTVFGFPEEKYYFLTKDYTFTDNLSAYLKETHAEPEKINMMFIPESVRPEILARLKKLNGIELTFSNVDNIEINKKGCDKGTALYSLCKVLGIDPRNTMAAGDNGNDLGMLKAAGFAAVVGNGIEEAKAIADAVVAPCIEDGFAEAVERFALR